jgi:hypothetical protein
MPRECPHEKERNPLTNRCIKKCPEDNERNQKGRCIKKCPEGKIRNPSTGRCINDKTRKKSAGKKSAKSPTKKSAKSSSKKSAKTAGKKSAKKAEKKSAKKAEKKSAKSPGKKSAKKAGKKMPVFTHWPIRPNEITLEEYNMFQEYNNFNPDKMIDLNLETLKDIKPFYRKLQVVLHPDRNNGVRLELFNRMQALYDKRYNNDRIYAQGENKDWKKSDV